MTMYSDDIITHNNTMLVNPGCIACTSTILVQNCSYPYVAAAQIKQVTAYINSGVHVSVLTNLRPLRHPPMSDKKRSCNHD